MRSLFVALIVFAVGCACSNSNSGSGAAGNKDSSGPRRIVAETRNEKYGLKVVFPGHEIEVGQRNSEVIDSVTLIQESSGTEARCSPMDEPSLTTSQGYFTDVWSPDEEFLVLPRGRFEGFCINPSSRALQNLAGKNCEDFVRVQSTGGPQLWHEFVGWTGDSAFEFDAGLSGSASRFEYDIRKHAVYSKDDRAFEFENALGPSQRVRSGR